MICARRLLWMAPLLAGCAAQTASLPAPQAPVAIVADFAQGAEGWVCGYADYHHSTAPDAVVCDHRPLPAPLSGHGLLVGGRNRSDDLFLYVKRAYDGFAPSARYRLTFAVDFVTNAPSSCFGVGGPPGEAVWVKAGASTVEPITVARNGYYTMNIEHGVQANSGRDALVLGHIANTNTDCAKRRYERKSLASPRPLELTTDASGRIWLLIGMDSGYEASSHMYYRMLVVTAERVKP